MNDVFNAGTSDSSKTCCAQNCFHCYYLYIIIICDVSLNMKWCAFDYICLFCGHFSTGCFY